MVLQRPTRPSRTNTQKRCPFCYRGLEWKGRNSRDTWSNRQIWPWSAKWSRAKANRVLSRECTGHSKHPLPTTQETTLHMDITRWSVLKSDWLYSLPLRMENLYTVSKNKTWSWLWLRSWTKFKIITKFRLKLKKVGKTTRPFRYDLNHIPYDYTVEVTNTFKGLDLIDRVPEKLWVEVHDILQEALIETIPKKKKYKKAKGFSEEVLKIAVKRREARGKGEKERHTHLNAEFQRIARRDKVFVSNPCKDIEENNRMWKIRDLFKKIRDTNGTFHAKMGTVIEV